MSEVKSEVALGAVVKDKITGFEGVITSETHTRNKMIRFGVQPQASEGKEDELKDAWNFDSRQLKFVKNGPVKALQKIKHGISPGDYVRSMVNGQEGLVNEITYFLNGCAVVSCLRLREPKKGENKIWTMDVIDAEIIPEDELEEVEVRPAVKSRGSTGGPPTRVSFDD